MTFHIQQKPTSTTFKSKHKVREKKERKVIRSTKILVLKVLEEILEIYYYSTKWFFLIFQRPTSTISTRFGIGTKSSWLLRG